MKSLENYSFGRSRPTPASDGRLKQFTYVYLPEFHLVAHAIAFEFDEFEDDFVRIDSLFIPRFLINESDIADHMRLFEDPAQCVIQVGTYNGFVPEIDSVEALELYEPLRHDPQQFEEVDNTIERFYLSGIDHSRPSGVTVH